MLKPIAPLLCVVVGCVSPEQAPPALEEVSQALFRDFEDADALTGSLDDLALLLANIDFDADIDARAFTLTTLTWDDVGDTVIQGQDPEECGAVALAYASPWPPAAHSSYQVLEDLSVLGTASSYDRSFLEPDDPDCFPEMSCDLLRTENTILRESVLFSLSSDMRKDYRWVETEAGTAMLERGWLTESSHGEAGNNHLWQTFELEAWLPTENGSVRFFAHYAEAEYAGVSDDLAESLALSGAQSAMEAADTFLEKAND